MSKAIIINQSIGKSVGFVKGSSQTIDLINEILPTSVNPMTSHLYINVLSMTQDLDLTGWLPSGLLPDATVTVRKVDTSGFAIKFNDVHHNYSFARDKGELLSFKYNGTELQII